MSRGTWMGRPFEELTREELEEALALALGSAMELREWRIEYLQNTIAVKRQQLSDNEAKLAQAQANLMAALNRI